MCGALPLPLERFFPMPACCLGLGEAETRSLPTILVRTKLRSLDHNNKVVCSLVPIRYISEKTGTKSVPLSTFLLRSTRMKRKIPTLLLLTDHPFARSVALFFVMQKMKKWNTLPASMFPEGYNLGLFKAKVIRHLHFRETYNIIEHSVNKNASCGGLAQ